MKIVVLVNTLQSVNSAVYANHCQMWAYVKKHYPDDIFIFLTPHRMAIDVSRNWAAQVALEQEADYLMFIDDDVLVEPNTFSVLKSREKDIIMALTYIRGYPFPPMLFKDHPTDVRALTLYEDFEEHIDEQGLVKCSAIGFSCALIKMDLIRKMVPPYFVTGLNSTEDVYFCVEATKQFPETTIYCDTTIPTGHLLGQDAVMKNNVKQLREYYKSLEGPKVEDNGDRTYSYVEACMRNFQS